VNGPPLPAAGEVQILFAPLHLDREELNRRERFLATDEIRRANRLLDRRARDRFVSGRGFLRKSLAAYVGLLPEELRFGLGADGKPYLLDEFCARTLRFNLAHSGDLAVLAVTTGHEVGIDLERIRDDLPFREMAQRFFSPRERAELFSLSPESQLAAFYRCWTRKEAYLKGCGTGFSHPADTLDVSLLPNHPPALVMHRTSPGEPARWRLVDIPAPEGYCATLAFEGEAPVINVNTMT
jgi:4'-phosphopantetheinyl transferase